MRRLRREIQPGARRAVLDLDDPKVRIKRNFPVEPLLRGVGIDRRTFMRAGEKPFDAGRRVAREGLRRRLVERRASVQVIDLDENRAGLRCASPAQHGACPLHSAPAQIGCDPDVGAQAHRAQRPPARAAAVSCLTSRSVISAPEGRPRAFSNSRNACSVAAPSLPSGLTE